VHGHKRFKALWLLALAAVGALCLGLGVAKASAASSASPAASTSAIPSSDADTTVLRVGWSLSADSLNPFVGQATEAYTVYHLNYDFLVRYDADTLEPVPGLAESWSHSTDGKTWTFKLRQGVKWQDGEPFTAADVAFTYNYIIDNEMGNFSSLTSGINEAVATDDLTVEIRCNRPKANMLRTWIPILPEHIWSKIDPKAAGASYQNRPPIIGTGPFQVTEVKKGDYVKMVANPTFWGTRPTVDEILFVTYQNPDTMTQDLIGGSLDAAWGVPSAQFPKLANDESFKAIAYNLIGWDYLSMNCFAGTSRGNPVLRDKAFRVALNYAIDKERLCEVAWSGMANPGTSLMTPDTWVDPDYHWQPSPEQEYAYDPARAKELLDAAGYTDTNGDGLREGKDGKPIKLRLWARTESPESQKEGSLITSWFRDLGLKIQYQVMDDGIYYDAIWGYQGNEYSPDFDMYLWDWDGYADPTDTLNSFITSQIEYWNEPCWSNEEYDSLVEQASSELDPDKRKELVWQAQEVFYDDSPEIVLTYPDKLEAVNVSRWDGWTQMYDGLGAAFYTSYIRDSYLNLKPRTAAVDSSGGSNTALIVTIVAVVAVIVVVAVVLTVRSRRVAEEE